MANNNTNRRNTNVDQENLDLADKLLNRLKDVNKQISEGNNLLNKFGGSLDLSGEYQARILNNQQRYNEALLSNKSIQADVTKYSKDILDQKVKLIKLQREGASVDILQQEEEFLKLLEEEAKSTFDLYNTNKQAIEQSKRALELTGDNLTTLQEIARNKKNIGKTDFKSLDYTKQIQSVQEEIAIAINDGNTSLADSLLERQKVLEAAQKEAEAQDKINKKIEASRDKIVEFGDKILNLVPGGKDGFLGKALGLDTISAGLKEKVGGAMSTAFADAAAAGKTGLTAMFSAGTAGAGALMAALLPVLPIILAIAAAAAIAKLFMDADKEVAQLTKDLGISYKEAVKVKSAAIDIAVEMNMVGVTSKEVAAQMTELKKATGLNFGLLAQTNDKAKAFLETSTMLTAQFGMTADETVALNASAAILGTSVDKLGLAANKMGDELMSSTEIMKTIGKTSKSILFNFKGNVGALAAAVKQAKLMGTTLEKVEAIGDKMLDIESSIVAESKARVMLGKNINLDAARYYALTGQTEKLMEEIKKQAGSVADYEKMSRMERKILADALGMSNDELAEMMAKEKELETLGYDAAKLQEVKNKARLGELDLAAELANMADDEAKEKLKAIVNEERRAGIQEKLASTIQKVTDLLFKMVEPLLPMIDDFVASLGDGKGTLQSLSDTFSGIGKFISEVLIPILKITWSPVMQTISFFKTIIDKISEAMNGIFGPVKEGEKSFNVLSVIGDALLKVFSGIGVVIADVVMAPFMRFAGIIGGIIKIFQGDFVGGIKQIGGAILGFILLPFEVVGDFIDEVFGTNLVDSVKEVFSNVADAIFDILGGVWDVIAGIFTFDGDRILEGITSIGDGLYNALVQPFMDAWDWITGWFGGNSPSKLGESIVLGISSVASSLFDFLTAPFKMAWDFIGDLFGMGNLGNSIVDGVKSVFSEVGTYMKDILSKAWDVVTGIFTLDFDKAFSGLSDIGSMISDAFSNVSELITKAISYPFEKAISFVTDIFGKDVGGGIGKVLKGVKSAITTFIIKPFEYFKSFFSGVSKMFSGDFVGGIKEIGSAALQFILTPFKMIGDFIDSVFGTDIVSSVTDVFSSIGDSIIDIFSGVWDTIVGIFTFDGDKILGGLKNIGNSILAIFQTAWNGVMSMFGGVGESIVNGISSVGSSIVDSITAPFTQAWDNISGWLGFSPSELGNGIVKGISSVGGDIESNLTKPFENAEQKVADSAKGMADSMSGVSGTASISIQGLDTAGISQIKDIEKDLRRIKVDAIKEKLEELSDAFNAMDWALLKEFSNLANVSLDEAGKSLIGGINSLTGISKSVNLDSLKDTFEDLSDTLDELDWESLKTFATLATTNLSEAGNSLIGGINSLTGISKEVNLSALEDTFSDLMDTLDELDWDILKTFATLATTNLSDASKSIIGGINSLTGINKEVNLGALEDTFADLTDTLDELDWESLKAFASLASGNLENAGTAIINGIKSLATINEEAIDNLDLSGAEAAFSKISDVLDNLDTDALQAFSQTNISGLSAVITALTTSITTLSTISDKSKELSDVESTFESLTDTIRQIDVDALQEFGNLNLNNLSTVATALATGIIAIASIKDLSSSLEKVGSTFDSLQSALNELDLNVIEDFSDLQLDMFVENITLLKQALNSLSEVSLDAVLVSTMSQLTDVIDILSSGVIDDFSELELDIFVENAKKLASGYNELSNIQTNPEPIIQTTDALNYFSNSAEYIADTLSEFISTDPFDVFRQLQSLDSQTITAASQAILESGNSLTSFSAQLSAIDDSIVDKGNLISSVLSEFADIEYDEIDSLATAIDNLAKSYDTLMASMKSITDEDITRMQQITSATPKDVGAGGITDVISDTLGSAMSGVKDLASSAISSVGSFFGFGEEEPATETPVAVPAPVTPVMQPTATITPAVTATAPVTNTITQSDNKKLEDLLRELIAKVDQPVIMKIGEKAVNEISNQISIRKSYAGNMNTGRA